MIKIISPILFLFLGSVLMIKNVAASNSDIVRNKSYYLPESHLLIYMLFLLQLTCSDWLFRLMYDDKEVILFDVSEELFSPKIAVEATLFRVILNDGGGYYIRY